MIKIIKWILSFYGLIVVHEDFLIDKIILDKPELEDHILHFMTRFNELQSDGEWKAHQVYAAMIKKFPGISKSKLRLDMEIVYQKHFKHA